MRCYMDLLNDIDMTIDDVVIDHSCFFVEFIFKTGCGISSDFGESSKSDCTDFFLEYMIIL